MIRYLEAMSETQTGINIDPVDRYTSAHVGWGVVLARVGIPWWGALASSVLWESAENGVKRQFPHLFPYGSPDSFVNAATDALAVMLGHAAASYAIGRGLGNQGRTAVDAITGSTLGALLGSVGFGMVGGGKQEEGIARGRIGYRVGSVVGGAVGSMVAGHGPLAAGAAAAGGAMLGPLGAGVGGYLTGGIFRDENPDLLEEFL